MPQTMQSLWLSWAQIRPLLKMRPATGRLWLDVIWLLLTCAVHTTILPTLTQGLVVVDVMTAWLVTSLVLETLPRSLFLAMLAAFLLETHSAVPAGLYACAYWVIAVTIFLTRGTLSWRHGLPWFLTYLLSLLWVIGFETFVLAVSASSPPFTWGYAYAQASRLLLSVGLGMVLCQRFIRDGFTAEET